MSLSPDALSVGVRALAFVALFQAAGATLFLAIFWRSLPASRAASVRVARASACIGIALVLAHMWLDAARMAGDFTGLSDPSLLRLAWSSTGGMSQAVQLAGLALIALTSTPRAKPAHPRSTVSAITLTSAPSRMTGVGLGGALLAIAAFALTGHTSEHPLRPVLASLLVVHLIVVAFWFGALLPLRLLTRMETPAGAALVVRHFSALATWLVPLLGVAGLSLAALLAGRISVLRTPYGELLLGKLAGFLLLLVFAAYNKWRLTPALDAVTGRGITVSSVPPARAKQLLRGSLTAEYLLIVAVLCATAVLTTFFSPT